MILRLVSDFPMEIHVIVRGVGASAFDANAVVHCFAADFGGIGADRARVVTCCAAVLAVGHELAGFILNLVRRWYLHFYQCLRRCPNRGDESSQSTLDLLYLRHRVSDRIVHLHEQLVLVTPRLEDFDRV